MRSLAAPFALGLLLASSAALADEPEDPRPAPASASASLTPPAPTTETEWYGWQPLIADGAFIGSIFVAPRLSRNGDMPPGFGYLLLADYLLASPIIHLAHDRPWTAAGSLLLRAGLPIVGMFVVAAASTRKNEDDDIEAVVVGGSLGILGAMIIDDVALARHEVPVRPAEGLTVSPSAMATRGGATFGLAGTF